MAKKLTTILFILLTLGGLYAGAYVYRALQSTPERIVQRFVQELAAGETASAYARLSPTLTRGRETYWRDFLKQFKQDADATQPRLISHEQLKNTFNTQPEHSEPERFTYALKRAGQDYRLAIITLKTDKRWVIADLY